MIYHETLRPQFHFTAQTGWLNDPNGLVYHNGTYHLFFQHNPYGNNWGHMTWGHATSTDLVHWKQLDNALNEDDMGMMFSGSAVIDHGNTAGFGKEAIVAIYTADGRAAKPKTKTTQCIAYSTDNGRTFTKYDGNPIIDEITPGNRDPKVFFHKPTNKWIMVLYVEDPPTQSIRFFSSDDLKNWEHLSDLEGFHECPDCFRLGDKWVLFGAHGYYVIGDFDGKQFTVTSGQHVGDFGPNFYAAQTYSDIPADDGRRIIVGWMQGGKYPNMPFNQQMSFPCELTMVDGWLNKWPVREIENLYTTTHDNLDTDAELLDIEAEIEINDATICGFNIRGLQIRYLPGDETLVVGHPRTYAPLEMIDGKISLRMLIDRSSIEIFGNKGQMALSTCFIPNPDQPNITFYNQSPKAKITKLTVNELKSAWDNS